jgi:hypothetical protein
LGLGLTTLHRKKINVLRKPNRTSYLDRFFGYSAQLHRVSLVRLFNEAEWTPFQTQYFSENQVAPGIEHGPLDPKPETLAARPQRRSLLYVVTFFKY